MFAHSSFLLLGESEDDSDNDGGDGGGNGAGVVAFVSQAVAGLCVNT